MTRERAAGFGLAALFLGMVWHWEPGFVEASIQDWVFLYALAFVSLIWIKPERDWVTYGLIAFGTYAGLSLLWSPDHAQGISQFVKLVTLIVICLAGRQLGARWLPWAAVLSLPIVIFNGWWGGFGNENFETEFLILLVPWFLIAPIWVGLPALLVCLGLLIDNPSRIEFFVAYGLIGLWLARRRWWGGLVAWLALPLFVLAWAPDAVWPLISDSVLARAELWIDSSYVWLQNPIFGTGLGGFNYTYPLYGSEHLRFFDRTEIVFGRHAGAAHNDWLQLLAELGVAGLCLSLISLRRVFHSGPAALTVILIGFEMCLEFPAQMPVTAFLGAYCLGVALSSSSQAFCTWECLNIARSVTSAWRSSRWTPSRSRPSH